MTNQNREPMFSIVLPTYNVAEYIGRCLESCVAQTHEDFEVIVVDDCGTDDSIAKAERWAELDKRIRIVRNPRNLGTFHARRIGVEAAEGEYVLFLDPDDAIHKEALSIINESIKGCRVDLILYGVTEIPKNKKHALSLPKNCSSNEEIFNNIFLKSSSLSYGTAGKAFSRITLSKAYATINANIEDRLVYAEDVLLFYAAALFSRTSKSIQMPLYIYYREPSSITRRNSTDGIAFKISQIYLIVSYLYKVLSSKTDISEIAELSGKKVAGKILSDAALIKRNKKNNFGKDQYITCVYESLRMRGGYSDAIRLAACIFSLGLIRL